MGQIMDLEWDTHYPEIDRGVLPLW